MRREKVVKAVAILMSVCMVAPATVFSLSLIHIFKLDVQASGESYTLNLQNTNAKVTLPSGAKDISVMPWAEKFGKTLSYPSLEIKTINGETLTGDWSAGGTITTENGNTVITPPEWSSKAVAPGDTLTFTFKSGKGTASLSNIQSVTLRQKAVSSGSIISRNVLYENNESGVVETTTEKVTTTKAPETTSKTEQVTTVPEVPATTAPEQTTTKKASTGAYHE